MCEKIEKQKKKMRERVNVNIVLTIITEFS